MAYQEFFIQRPAVTPTIEVLDQSQHYNRMMNESE